MAKRAEPSVGASVVVPGGRRGIIELDNEDGTWNVRCEDGTEADVPAGDVRLASGVDNGLYSGRARLASPEEPRPEGWTRFACFSDTHGKHGKIPQAHLPEVDVLLHAGDFSNTGEIEQVRSFAEWLRGYPAKHKVVIAGNHDVTFHPDYYQHAWKRYHRRPYACDEARAALACSGACQYLEDAEAEVLGYKIYGTPWQPAFCDWAFNLQSAAESLAAWDRIPADADVLLVHGPPHGQGDECVGGRRVGCQLLAACVRERALPVVVAGHIHEGYGAAGDGPTLYVNASTCNLSYQPVNPPIVFDLPPPDELRGPCLERGRAGS